MTIISAQSLQFCAYCQTNQTPANIIYDFSDEAQEEFNKRNSVPPTYTQNYNIYTDTQTDIDIDEIVNENYTTPTIDAFAPQPNYNTKTNKFETNIIQIPSGTSLTAVLQSSISY